MKELNKKKSVTGWVALAAAVAVLIGALSTGLFYVNRSHAQSKAALENLYQENVYEIAESLSNVETNLSKLMVSGDDAESMLLLNDTYRHCLCAVCALSSLPVSHEDSVATAKFLNQLGDWCNSHSKRLLDENYDTVYAVLGDSTLETQAANKKEAEFDSQLEQLYTRAAALNRNVQEAAASIGGRHKLLSNMRDGVLKDFDINETPPLFSTNSDTNAKNSTEYPQLIYDGPFSDGASKKEFKGLKNRQEISLAEAETKAEEYFKDMNLRGLEHIGETQQPDGYCLRGRTDDGEMYLTISKCGGLPLSVIVPYRNKGGERKYGEDSAKDKAVSYAKMCGYDKDLVPVWYNEIDGFAVVNLVPKVDGVICYPDLIKVKLDLAGGNLIALEATGFCACNTERKLIADISADEAKSALNPKLSVYSCRLALIPKDNAEVLCYELACKYKGLDYFIYIDAKTGRQRNIMRVVDRDQGKLVV